MLTDFQKPAIWAFDPSAVDPFWYDRFWQDCIFCVPAWENAKGQSPHILWGKKKGASFLANSLGVVGSDLLWASNAAGPAMYFPNNNTDWQVPAIASLDPIPTSRVTYLIVRRKTATAITNASSWGVYDAGAGRAGGHYPYVDGTVYWDFGGTGSPNRLTWSGYSPSVAVERWAFVAGTRGSAIYFNGQQKASQATAITRTAVNNVVGMNGENIGSSDPQEVSFLAALDTEWTPGQVAEWAEDPFAPLRLTVGGTSTAFLPSVNFQRSLMPAL